MILHSINIKKGYNHEEKSTVSDTFITFLTSCAHSGDTIQDIHIQAEDFLPPSEDNILSSEDTVVETDEASSEADESSAESVKAFDENNHFQECPALASPVSVSGINFIGKENDRYLFAFPDNDKTAGRLYNEYGALLQRDGFTLAEYEGNHIIQKNAESVAFMGTGHNTKYDHIMLIAFYSEE